MKRVKMMIRVTNRCQMTCRHCLSNSSPEGSKGNMMDIFAEIDKLGKAKIDDLIFSGGECFLEPKRIEETIKYVLDAKIEIGELSFMTNGLEFRKNSEFIAELIHKFKLEGTTIDIRLSRSKFHIEQKAVDIDEFKKLCKSNGYTYVIYSFEEDKELYLQGRSLLNRESLEREGFTFSDNSTLEAYTKVATLV